MKLDTILAVCSGDNYSQCVPYFLQTWKKAFPECCVYVIYISDRLPSYLEAYHENIILVPFNPIYNSIPMDTIAKQMRVFMPSLWKNISRKRITGKIKDDDDEIVMMVNINLLACNPSIFANAVQPFENNMMIQLLDTNHPLYNPVFPICYTIASTSTWHELLGISTWDDMYKSIQTDKNSTNLLRDIIMNWEPREKRIRIAGTGNIQFLRLGASKGDLDCTEKDMPLFADAELKLPFSSYEFENKALFNKIMAYHV